jgi:sulfite reductase alpha subunit-like flavoprotein
MHSPAASTYSLASTSAVDRVVILYASETGNAQDTAERVGREFRRRGRAVTLLSMDMFDIVSCPSLLQLQGAPS